jgi:FdhD protein
MIETAQPITARAYHNGTATKTTRMIPEEVAVAFTYDRATYAVMMATPADLEDFAIGFTLSEGIVGCVDDITSLDIMVVEQGIECRMTLENAAQARVASRRRRIAGPVGCGLCGIESLEEAARSIPQVTSSLTVTAEAIMEAIRTMPHLQTLNRKTHGVHAAAFLDSSDGSLILREDVGRHNALDKLIGAAAQASMPGGRGAVLMTSRISIELIQKCAMLGAPILVAVSVPTAHALRAAEKAGITLAAIARNDGFEVFTHDMRINIGANLHVA